MQQRRTLVLTAVIALMIVATAWMIILRPLAPDPVSASPGTPSGTSSSTTAPARSSTAPTKPGQPTTATASPAESAGPSASQPASNRCVAGVPARLVIPALGVNATFQDIGVDTSAPADSQGRRPLGNPSDRTQAGWYSAGPQPGSGTGTVLVNGHTYHDGSAIFKDSFASQIADGQRIDVVQVNGSTCSYQVQRVWRDVAKSDYPSIVSGQNLYNFSGPERLFLATCGGPFNSAEQNYDYINLLIATPIDRG